MVLTVKLEKQEEEWLALVSKRRHLNKSQAAKYLINRGFLMCQLDEYKARNISLGKFAETLNISSIEALTYVATHNAHPDRFC